MNKLLNYILSFFMVICIMLCIVTSSIAVPILFRSFYYNSIEKFEIVDRTGYSKNIIINAYDEMLDYCTGKTNNFSLGVFNYSNEGYEHFKDCRRLFVLDFLIASISFVLIIIIKILNKKRIINLIRFKNHNLSFYSVIILSILFFVVLIYSLIDFYSLFLVFHKILFPGKSNYIFEVTRDPIITILPSVFFEKCLILIISLIIITSIILIIKDLIDRKKCKSC